MADTKTTRPDIEIEPAPYHAILGIVSLAALVAVGVWLASSWSSIPDTVYTHFGASGKPDDSGPKLFLVLLPALGLAEWIVMTVLARHPRIYNYPVAITPENAERQYSNAVGMILWMRSVVSLLLAFLGWASAQSSMDGRALPHFWIMWIFMGLIMVVVIGGLTRAVRDR